MEDKKLPPIPDGWGILDTTEPVLPGDMWSYHSRLDIHRWIPCKRTNEPQLTYNVYIRKRPQ